MEQPPTASSNEPPDRSERSDPGPARRRPRLAPERVVAGGAPSLLEELQTLQEKLSAIVEQWEDEPENVRSSLKSARELIKRARRTLERDVTAHEGSSARYAPVREDLLQRYRVAIDAILVLDPVLEIADEVQDAPSRRPGRVRSDMRDVVVTQRETITAVEEFSTLFSALVDQLVDQLTRPSDDAGDEAPPAS
jgi:hypothetical protein